MRAPLKAKLPTYTIQLLLGPFERKVLCILQLQRQVRGKCLACLPLNTPLYITLTMILYENMKPIEHVLLHPIYVLPHPMCACQMQCKVILLNTLKLLMRLSLQKTQISRDFS